LGGKQRREFRGEGGAQENLKIIEEQGGVRKRKNTVGEYADGGGRV